MKLGPDRKDDYHSNDNVHRYLLISTPLPIIELILIFTFYLDQNGRILFSILRCREKLMIWIF